MFCELCQCEEAYNFHHFIPRTLHSNKWFKRRYTRQEMQQGMEKAYVLEVYTTTKGAVF